MGVFTCLYYRVFSFMMGIMRIDFEYRGKFDFVQIYMYMFDYSNVQLIALIEVIKSNFYYVELKSLYILSFIPNLFSR